MLIYKTTHDIHSCLILSVFLYDQLCEDGLYSVHLRLSPSSNFISLVTRPEVVFIPILRCQKSCLVQALAARVTEGNRWWVVITLSTTNLGHWWTLHAIVHTSEVSGCPHLTEECWWSTQASGTAMYTHDPTVKFDICYLSRCIFLFVGIHKDASLTQWTAAAQQDICTNTQQAYYIPGALRISPHKFQQLYSRTAQY